MNDGNTSARTELGRIADGGKRVCEFPAACSVKTLKGILPKPLSQVSLENMDEAIAQGASEGFKNPLTNPS